MSHKTPANDIGETKRQLIDELAELRNRVRELEAAAGADLPASQKTELRESEKRFRQLAEATWEAIVIHDNGVLLEANPQYFEMFGYSEEELVGREAISKTVTSESLQLIRQQIAEGGVGPYTAVGRRKNGDEFPMELRIRMMSYRGRDVRVAAIRNITDRRETEAKLRMHSLVLDQIQDRVTVTDLDGVVTYVNQAETDTLGYSIDELIGQPVTMYGDDPERGATQQEIISETLRNGHWRGEVVNHTAGGRDIVLDCRTQVVNDESGRPVAMCGISTDITKRVESEMALSESEDRFRKLADVTFEGIVIHNQGVAVDVNQSLVRMFGYEREELMGVNLIEMFVPKEHQQIVIDNIVKKHPKPYETVAKRKDGSLFPVEFEARNLEEGSGSLRVTAVRDITERKRAEEALRQSEERFKKLSNVTFEGIMIHDNGVVLDANESLLEMFGYERNEIIGRNVIEFCVPLEYCDVIVENTAREYAKPYEVIATRKDGETFPVEIEARVIGDPADGIRVAAVRDITERKRAEEALRASELRYRNLFDNALVGLFQSRLSDGLFTDVNPRGAELLGLPKDEVIGKIRTAELYEDPERREELLSILRRDGEAHGFETDMTLHNGKRATFAISVKSSMSGCSRLLSPSI